MILNSYGSLNWKRLSCPSLSDVPGLETLPLDLLSSLVLLSSWFLCLEKLISNSWLQLLLFVLCHCGLCFPLPGRWQHSSHGLYFHLLPASVSPKHCSHLVSSPVWHIHVPLLNSFQNSSLPPRLNSRTNLERTEPLRSVTRHTFHFHLSSSCYVVLIHWNSGLR